jgi:hypothetical protein
MTLAACAGVIYEPLSFIRTSMADAVYFRDKAKQCRALADLSISVWVADMLLQLAREFELQAVNEDIRAMTAADHPAGERG